MKKLISISIALLFFQLISHAQCKPDAGVNDTVCSDTYFLKGTLSSGGSTCQWTGPAGSVFSDATDPHSSVKITLNQSLISVWFYLTETHETCVEKDSVKITFAQMPVAKAGQMQIICGNTVCLNANIVGSEFATGTWISIPGVQFENVHSPTACATIKEGVFGDTCRAIIPFIWIMDNNGCTDKDTVWNYFYCKPEAEAYFLDVDTVKMCGLWFTMHAILSIDSSIGEWSVLKYPSGINPAEIKLDDKYDPETNVLVPDSGYYTFLWTEENIHYPVCSSTDTLVIRFISVPDIFAGYDTTVCSDSVQMNAISDCGTGEWIENLAVWYSNKNDPHTWAGPIDGADDNYYIFVWKEYNGPYVVMDTVRVYFGRVPEPVITCNSPMYNCGLTTTYNNQLKSLSQFGYKGYWTAPATSGETFNPDSSKLNVYVTVPDYGKHIFYRCENNNGCIGCSDSVVIYFIKQPIADAGGGADNADTCYGLSYPLKPLLSTINANVFWSASCNDVFFNGTGAQSSAIYNDTLVSSVYQKCTLFWKEDNGHNCEDMDTLYLTFLPVSVDDIKNSAYSLYVYPNPADDYINISYNLNKHSKVLIEMFNISGNKPETILSADQDEGEYNHSFSIEKQGLSPGFYYIRACFDHSVYLKKVVIVK